MKKKAVKDKNRQKAKQRQKRKKFTFESAADFIGSMHNHCPIQVKK